MDIGYNRVATTNRDIGSDIRRPNDKPTETRGSRIRATVWKSFLVILWVELVVVVSWLVLNAAMGFMPEIESTLAVSGSGLIFIVVGWVIAGLPLALIAEHRGWGKTYITSLPLGSVVGGLTSALLTYAFFIDGPEVATALLRLTLPLGAVAGLVAALAWLKLEGSRKDNLK